MGVTRETATGLRGAGLCGRSLWMMTEVAASASKRRRRRRCFPHDKDVQFINIGWNHFWSKLQGDPYVHYQYWRKHDTREGPLDQLLYSVHVRPGGQRPQLQLGAA